MVHVNKFTYGPRGPGSRLVMSSPGLLPGPALHDPGPVALTARPGPLAAAGHRVDRDQGDLGHALRGHLGFTIPGQTITCSVPVAAGGAYSRTVTAAARLPQTLGEALAQVRDGRSAVVSGHVALV